MSYELLQTYHNTPRLINLDCMLSRARHQPGGHVTSRPGGGAVWKDKVSE